MPLMMSITAAALRRAVQRLMSSGSLLMSCVRLWIGLPEKHDQSQPGRARPRRAWGWPILAGRSSMARSKFRPCYLSNFCGGRSSGRARGKLFLFRSTSGGAVVPDGASANRSRRHLGLWVPIVPAGYGMLNSGVENTTSISSQRLFFAPPMVLFHVCRRAFGERRWSLALILLLAAIAFPDARCPRNSNEA